MFRSIARDRNNSFPENLCQIIAFKLLEDVTKNQIVQSSVALVINSQSQNEYKCTQDVFRVLKKIIIRTFFHENNDFKKHEIAIKILII